MSPVFKREDDFCFKIYSNEELRKHIHVIKAECEAKFWLEPTVELAENFGFKPKELKKINQMLEQYGDDFKRQFTEHISKRIDD